MLQKLSLPPRLNCSEIYRFNIVILVLWKGPVYIPVTPIFAHIPLEAGSSM